MGILFCKLNFDLLTADLNTYVLSNENKQYNIIVKVHLKVVKLAIIV